MKMRIAIFLGGYLPAKKYGGPVTSISNLVDNLGDEMEIYIISNDHDLNESARLPGIREGWNDVGKAKVLYLSEKEYGKRRFSGILQEIKADLVYLSSVFYYRMNFPAILAANKLGVPVLLAPRGELCEGAMRVGETKKRMFLSLAKTVGIFRGVNFHTTSAEEENSIPRWIGGKCGRIFNLPNLPCMIDKSGISRKEPGTVLLTYISRIVRKKNLLFAIKCVNHAKGRVVFDVYGPREDEAYWEECRKEIMKAPENVTITYQGAIDPGTSKEVFRRYNAFLFPTLSENYGHVIAEALTAGCHPILSRGTTPWDDVDGNGGFAISLDAPDAWTAAVDRLAAMTQEEYDALEQALSAYTERKLSTDELKRKYVSMFRSVIHRSSETPEQQ